ncbi:hypothetical protein FHW68_001682 [Pseudomonas sp. Tn43]|uniref:hypothetical protein n=1 Tax=Pseudomonas sp. Tn43 TaxID=701213 RepID=UPI0016135DFD|nr:hypothetical protein [Pseudomonas sp. Tn43]MBB3240191.1 hypothetical protein [Pseudomonas sp. Tn43]
MMGNGGASFRGFRRNGVLIAFNDLMPGYALNKLTDVLKMGVAISAEFIQLENKSIPASVIIETLGFTLSGARGNFVSRSKH